MNNFSYFVILFGSVILLFHNGCGSDSHQGVNPDVIMVTDKGDVGLILYQETPQHRENFLKLVRENYFDSLLFHRVIANFMIQSGDPRTRNAQTMKDSTLGDDPGYTLPAEIVETFVHTSGKLAAARYPDEQNPEWRSSGSQFYIVTGAPVTSSRLDSMEMQYNYVRKGRFFTEWQVEVGNGEFSGTFDEFLVSKNFQDFHYTPAHRRAYKESGNGAPWLDFQYTIFGEVVSGMDVVKAIGRVETDPWPAKPVRILKMYVPDTP
ncbi:MAG: peptidylprolyl isomerase [Bacteroidia bacterium]